MKLQTLKTTVVRLPHQFPGEPVPQWTLPPQHTIVIEIATDGGIEGISYAFVMNERHVKPLHAYIQALWELLAGQDPVPIDRLWQRLYRDSMGSGLRGLGQVAISSLDVALWDLQGKLFGQPVYKLLGGCHDSIDAYASYNLYTNVPDDILANRCGAFVKQGFRAVKPRVSSGRNVPHEVQRIKLVREAVGPDVHVMLDAIAAWTPDMAIQMGRALEPFNLFWLEDPASPEDFGGLARVAKALDVPIAAGEHHSTKFAFRDLIQRECVDIVMVDLQKVGGFTEWRKVAAYAEAHGLPVVSHRSTELCMHLLCAIPNGMYVEYQPWSFPLFKEVPQLKNGSLAPFDKPGLGLELDHKSIQRYRV